MTSILGLPGPLVQQPKKLNIPGITTTGTTQTGAPGAPTTTTGAPVPGMTSTGFPTAPTPAAVPGTFSATDNLINKQFTNAPTASPGYQAVGGPDYSGVNSILQQLTKNIGAPSAGGPGTQGFDYSADTQKVRGLTMQSLEGALQGTDRGKIAGDTYDLLEERSRPEFDQRVRSLGQNTAALGRVGSGIYGSNLTDLNSERERELGLNKRELANTAAGASLSDRLSLLDASRGVGSDFSAQDLNRGNVNASMAGAAGRGNEFNQNLQLADLMASLADRSYGANVNERDTQYGTGRDQYGDAVNERGYQKGLETEARDDRYRARGFEEDLTNSAFDRDVRTRSLEDELYGNDFNRGLDLYNTGRAGDPTGQLNRQSSRYDQQSADAGDSFAELMASYGARRQGQQPPRLPASIYAEPDRINDIVNSGF